MLKRGYSPEIAAGAICASGTLGQIIPPSIILVMLGDVMSSAYQQAQLAQGVFSPDTVSVGDLFAGALIPGLLLVLLYIGYIVAVAIVRPNAMPAHPAETRVSIGAIAHALLPPLTLIFAVLGSILLGLATPTEAAGVGAAGALLIALGSARAQRRTAARHHAGNAEDQQHGVHDPDRRVGVLARVSRVRGGRRRPRHTGSASRRRHRRRRRGHVGNVPTGLRARLH